MDIRLKPHVNIHNFSSVFSGYINAMCSKCVLFEAWHYKNDEIVCTGKTKTYAELVNGVFKDSWFPLNSKTNQSLNCIIIPIYNEYNSEENECKGDWSLAIVCLNNDPLVKASINIELFTFRKEFINQDEYYIQYFNEIKEALSRHEIVYVNKVVFQYIPHFLNCVVSLSSNEYLKYNERKSKKKGLMSQHLAKKSYASSSFSGSNLLLDITAVYTAFVARKISYVTRKFGCFFDKLDTRFIEMCFAEDRLDHPNNNIVKKVFDFVRLYFKLTKNMGTIDTEKEEEQQQLSPSYSSVANGKLLSSSLKKHHKNKIHVSASSFMPLHKTPKSNAIPKNGTASNNANINIRNMMSQTLKTLMLSKSELRKSADLMCDINNTYIIPSLTQHLLYKLSRIHDKTKFTFITSIKQLNVSDNSMPSYENGYGLNGVNSFTFSSSTQSNLSSSNGFFKFKDPYDHSYERYMKKNKNEDNNNNNVSSCSVFYNNRVIMYGNSKIGYVLIVRFMQNWFLYGICTCGIITMPTINDIECKLGQEIDTETFLLRFKFPPVNPVETSWNICLHVCWWISVNGKPPSKYNMKEIAYTYCENNAALEQRKLMKYGFSTLAWTYTCTQSSVLNVYSHKKMVSSSASSSLSTVPVYSMEEMVRYDHEKEKPYNFLNERHAENFNLWLLKHDSNIPDNNKKTFYFYLKYVAYPSVFMNIQLLPCELPSTFPGSIEETCNVIDSSSSSSPGLLESQEEEEKEECHHERKLNEYFVDLVNFPMSKYSSLHAKSKLTRYSLVEMLKKNASLYTVTRSSSNPNSHIIDKTTHSLDSVFDLIQRDIIDMYEPIPCRKHYRKPVAVFHSTQSDGTPNDNNNQTTRNDDDDDERSSSSIYCCTKDYYVHCDCIMLELDRNGSKVLHNYEINNISSTSRKTKSKKKLLYSSNTNWIPIPTLIEYWKTKTWMFKYFNVPVYKWLSNIEEMKKHIESQGVKNEDNANIDSMTPGSPSSKQFMDKLVTVPYRILKTNRNKYADTDSFSSSAVITDENEMFEMPYSIIKDLLGCEKKNVLYWLNFQLYPIKLWLYKQNNEYHKMQLIKEYRYSRGLKKDKRERMEFWFLPLSIITNALDVVITLPDEEIKQEIYGPKLKTDVLRRIFCLSETQLFIEYIEYDFFDNCITFDLKDVSEIMKDLFNYYVIKINEILELLNEKKTDTPMHVIKKELDSKIQTLMHDIMFERNNDDNYGVDEEEEDRCLYNFNDITKYLLILGI